MSFDPFAQRLQERTEVKDSITETLDSLTETESISEDPFSERLQQKESIANTLWNDFYDMTFSPDETPFEKGLGQSLRSVGTTLGGLPGDLINLAKGAADALTKKSPFASPPKENFAANLARQGIEKIPTSSDLMEKFDSITQGRYAPGSRSEEFAQELGSDLVTLRLAVKGWGSFFKMLGIGVGSNLAKEGAKELGIGEKGQAATKLGTMFALSTFNPKGANKFVEHLYNKAYSNLPKTAEINATPFIHKLDKLHTDLKKGLVNVESKKPVLNAIKDVERNIKGGRINIKSLTQAKRDLNEQRLAKIFDPEFKGTKKARAALKKNYGDLAKIMDKTIEEYGVKHPEFFAPYKEANIGWGGIEQSRKASKFIERTLKNPKTYYAGMALSPLFKSLGMGIGVKGGVGAFGALKSYELMYRIMKNPVLRKYYGQMMMEASRENAPALIRNAEKLRKEMENTQSENP